MSLSKLFAEVVHKLDTEAADKLKSVPPVLDKLRTDIKPIITDAAEQAQPGLRAALDAAVNTAIEDLIKILGL